MKTASGPDGAGWAATILLSLLYLSVPGHCFACATLSRDTKDERQLISQQFSHRKQFHVHLKCRNVLPTNSVIDRRKRTNPCFPDGKQNRSSLNLSFSSTHILWHFYHVSLSVVRLSVEVVWRMLSPITLIQFAFCAHAFDRLSKTKLYRQSRTVF